jgi:hypothetical protein
MKNVWILFLAVVLAAWPAAAWAVAPFTIVALPDAQNMTEGAAPGPDMFNAETAWAVSQRVSENIVFVTNEGDLTNNRTAAGWQNAQAAMFALNAANIPFGVSPGNHDSDNGVGVGYTGFNAYFGPAQFAGKSWYCPGSPGPSAAGQNSYQTFTVNGRTYLNVNLEYTSSNAVGWAQQVIANNPGKPTILTVHDYLTGAGDRSSNGAAVWSSLVYPAAYSQVFMVLGGHAWPGSAPDMPAVTPQLNAAGKVVYEMLADYQSVNGGNGYLRLLKFDEDAGKIGVSTISPYLGTSLTTGNNQFDLAVPVSFNDRFGSPVPEPSALVLSGMGVAGLLAVFFLRLRFRLQ